MLTSNSENNPPHSSAKQIMLIHCKRFTSVTKINLVFVRDMGYNDFRVNCLIHKVERIDIMNLARVSSNGQVTVPMDIRRLLNLREGTKILFVQRENGDVVIENASINALIKAQEAFEGVAEELGFPDEDVVQSWIDELRYGKKGE
jgi:AbrB family looped-hinge helix DNA binding protein